jgi:hypothetical protein
MIEKVTLEPDQKNNNTCPNQANLCHRDWEKKNDVHVLKCFEELLPDNFFESYADTNNSGSDDCDDNDDSDIELDSCCTSSGECDQIKIIIRNPSHPIIVDFPKEPREQRLVTKYGFSLKPRIIQLMKGGLKNRMMFRDTF